MDAGHLGKRPSIAEIIRTAGAIDAPGGTSDAFAELAALAALAASVVPGASAAQLAAGEALGTMLAERLHFADSQDSTEARAFAVSYETLGRALVLALHASGAKLGVAFDTATGSALEGKIGMKLTAPEITLSLALTDLGANASSLSAKSHHVGYDWLKYNSKTLDTLFAGIDGYLKQFAS